MSTKLLLGLCLRLESGRGDKLSHSMKQYIQNLLKVTNFNFKISVAFDFSCFN